MKLLILSFFAVLLCYSFFFDNKKEKDTINSEMNNSARIEIKTTTVTNNKADSIIQLTNKTAELFRK